MLYQDVPVGVDQIIGAEACTAVGGIVEVIFHEGIVGGHWNALILRVRQRTAGHAIHHDGTAVPAAVGGIVQLVVNPAALVLVVAHQADGEFVGDRQINESLHRVAFLTPLVNEKLLSKPPDTPLKSGLLVIRRTVPDCELAPKSVPCGPGNTSIRERSAA